MRPIRSVSIPCRGVDELYIRDDDMWRRGGVFETNVLRYFNGRDHATAAEIRAFLMNDDGGHRCHIPNNTQIRNILLKNGYTIRKIRIRTYDANGGTSLINVFYKPGVKP